MNTSNTWQRRDAWLGILFLAAGGLASVFAWLCFRGGWPPSLWVGAALLGSVMLLLGGNALVRSLRAGRRDAPR